MMKLYDGSNQGHCDLESKNKGIATPLSFQSTRTKKIGEK